MFPAVHLNYRTVSTELKLQRKCVEPLVQHYTPSIGGTQANKEIFERSHPWPNHSN
jgi:hypothetical protein